MGDVWGYVGKEKRQELLKVACSKPWAPCSPQCHTLRRFPSGPLSAW